jgi:hypothetical protein
MNNSEETMKRDDDISELNRAWLPGWAIKRAAGLEEGAHLPTRDGRRMGNGHIIQITPAPRGMIGLNYLVLTDAGNTIVMSESEITSCFYPPEFVSDVEEVIRKFWREPEPLIEPR